MFHILQQSYILENVTLRIEPFFFFSRRVTKCTKAFLTQQTGFEKSRPQHFY